MDQVKRLYLGYCTAAYASGESSTAMIMFIKASLLKHDGSYMTSEQVGHLCVRCMYLIREAFLVNSLKFIKTTNNINIMSMLDHFRRLSKQTPINYSQ